MLTNKRKYILAGVVILVFILGRLVVRASMNMLLGGT